MILPSQRSASGKRLVWNNEPLQADDPLSAWQSLLNSRGLHEQDPFFSPRLADLPDPFVMQDMAKAAQRVADAIKAQEHIHVFGDFDADGVNGTAILVQALRAAGAQVSCSIPHRSDDGHGIGIEPVREVIRQGAHLGLSVDTGSTCFEACEVAKQGDLDLIITDHHLPDQGLPPAFALLNPARDDCGFADRNLCGTGVAFFLLMATWRLLREQGHPVNFDLRTLLDRVAIATIADVMDLVGVNRILVYHGLKQINSAPSIGVQALMQEARIKKQVDVETIGFYLAPRINAAGRMQHGEAAMRLLCSDDMQQALSLAQELNEANKFRRQVEADVFKQAEAQLNGSDVIAIYDESWHAGVVGLVAGRLSRKHGRPAAVGFVTPENQVRVSLRGRPGFHIGDLLHACSEHLEGFGGHAGAGGGTVRSGVWQKFVKRFGEAVEQQAQTVDQSLTAPIDGVLSLNALHAGLAERLARFEPTGRGNNPCRWLIPQVYISQRQDLKGGVIRLSISDGSSTVAGVAFASAALGDALLPHQPMSLVGELQLDQWRGNGAVQFVVWDVIPEAS